MVRTWDMPTIHSMSRSRIDMSIYYLWHELMFLLVQSVAHVDQDRADILSPHYIYYVSQRCLNHRHPEGLGDRPYDECLTSTAPNKAVQANWWPSTTDKGTPRYPRYWNTFFYPTIHIDNFYRSFSVFPFCVTRNAFRPGTSAGLDFGAGSCDEFSFRL